jgi:hypothetical protein
MTGKASDFPTLALSRSGNTGISQPSQRRAPRVKILLKQIVRYKHLLEFSVTVAKATVQGVSTRPVACSMWPQLIVGRSFLYFLAIRFAIIKSLLPKHDKFVVFKPLQHDIFSCGKYFAEAIIKVSFKTNNEINRKKNQKTL